VATGMEMHVLCEWVDLARTWVPEQYVCVDHIDVDEIMMMISGIVFS
jgi:hypothetical protein